MNSADPPAPYDPRRRRRFPRYRADLKLGIRLLGPDGYSQLSGLCNQIGEGGLGAIISTELSIGEVVNLDLSLPSQPQPVSLRAVVRWRERLQHGFEFYGATPEQLAAIHGYCDTLTEEAQI
jgi:hypothetical protein